MDQQNQNIWIKRLLQCVCALLGVSIFCLILSCLGMLIFQLDSETVYGFMWFTVMGTVIVYYFTVLSLLIAITYFRIQKQKMWAYLRLPLLLLLVSVIVLGILACINYWIIEY